MTIYTTERLPNRTVKLPAGQSRTPVGTAPSFTCSITALPPTETTIIGGYVRKRLETDTPRSAKSKPYSVRQITNNSHCSWLHTTLKGASVCGSVKGSTWAGAGNIPSPKDSVLGNWADVTSTAVVIPSSLRSQASIMALNKIRGVKLDIAEFLGEFLETILMVKGAGRTGTRLVNAALRKDYKGFARIAFGLHRSKRWLNSQEYKNIKHRLSKKSRETALKQIEQARTKGQKVLTDNPSDHYFFWNFGILPLLSSLDDASKLTMGKPLSLYIKGFGFAVEERPLNFTDTNFEYTGKEIIKVCCHLKATANLADLSRLNLAFLGINSPIDVVRGLWAATPFTWLADYFTGIDRYLNAMAAPIGLDFFDGCFSIRVSSELKRTRLEFKTADYHITPGLSSVTIANGFRREPFTGWPLLGFMGIAYRLLQPVQYLNIGMLGVQKRS